MSKERNEGDHGKPKGDTMPPPSADETEASDPVQLLESASRRPEEVYDELCCDWPLLSSEDGSAFCSAMSGKVRVHLMPKATQKPLCFSGTTISPCGTPAATSAHLPQDI
eukprot:3762254-Rhodomonas_salina.3